MQRLTLRQCAQIEPSSRKEPTRRPSEATSRVGHAPHKNSTAMPGARASASPQPPSRACTQGGTCKSLPSMK